ncbi:MAG: purine-nucleoside phosphorylase [Balneolales bacterium]
MHKSAIPQSVLDIEYYLKSIDFVTTIDRAIILGSGMGAFVNRIEEADSIPYAQIPGFPQTSVSGHPGDLYTGRIGNKRILAFAGRFHLYEGFEIEKTLLPVQLSKTLGAELIIVTNAAGGINHNYDIGDLMLIEELISPFENNSLVGEKAFKKNQIYKIIEKVESLAQRLGIKIQRGNYVYVKGPSYETKAEIRAFRAMGADAAGMSTAAELIEAERLGLKNLGISLITNLATGMSVTKLDHDDINTVADLREKDFGDLMKQIIQSL